MSGNDFWSFGNGNGNGSAHSQTLGTGTGMKNFIPICDENVKKTQDLNNIIEEVFLVTLNKYSVVGGATTSTGSPDQAGRGAFLTHFFTLPYLIE